MSHTNRYGLVLSAALITVTAVFSVFASATPAHAHDQVVSATPGDNESLDTAPTEVVIEFNNELLDTGALINVTNAAGDDVTDGEVELDGRTVSRPLQADLPNGQYQIVWRVVSADGHPITDRYQFAIGEPVVAMDANESNAADTSESDDTGETEQPVVTAAQTQFDWGRIVGIAVVGALLGALIYAAIVALLKRAKNHSTTSKENT